MVPFDLREFAELRYRNGEPFGLSILELLDLEPEAERGRELLEALAEATGLTPPDGEEYRHVEYLADRSNILEEVDDVLKDAGFVDGDIDGRVRKILAKLEDVEFELEALQNELEDLKAPKPEYDL